MINSHVTRGKDLGHLNIITLIARCAKALTVQYIIIKKREIIEASKRKIPDICHGRSGKISLEIADVFKNSTARSATSHTAQSPDQLLTFDQSQMGLPTNR